MLVATFFLGAAEIGQITITGKLVYDLTHSDLDLGLIGLAQFMPVVLLVLVAGHIGDRFPRQRVVAVGAAGFAAVAGGLGWYAGTKPTSVVPIFGLVVLFGTSMAFMSPAVRGLPADIAGGGDLARVVARNSISWQAATIIGPVLAGFLYAADVRSPFFVISVLAAAGAVTVSFVDGASGSENVGRLSEGLRFVRNTPLVLGAISLDLFAVLFGGAVALLPAITGRLGAGAIGLGWLRAAAGLGAGAMTLVLAVRPLHHRIGRVLLCVVAVFGVATIVLGATRDYTVAFVAIVVLSAADAVSVFIRATLVPIVTPADKRGRVLAVENVFIGASNELGGFESGATAQVLGVPSSVILGGVATLIVAGAWWWVFPALRDVDDFPTSERFTTASG